MQLQKLHLLEEHTGLKKLSAAAQETLLQEAGLRSSATKPGTTLAMDTDLRFHGASCGSGLRYSK